MKRLTSILLCLLLSCSAITAQNKAGQDKKAKLEREIAILDQQIKDNNAKTRNANTTLNLTRSKIKARKGLIAESDAQIAGIDAQIRRQNQKLDSLRRRYDEISAKYDQLVLTAYKNRDSRVWYMYLMSSESLNQGLHRYGYLRKMARGLNTQAIEISNTREQIEAEKAELEKLRADAASLRRERVGELDRLKKDEANSQQLVASLNKDKNKYQKELNAKKKQVEALSREMEKMVKKSASKPKTEVDTRLSGQFSANKGRLPWPADGPVVESFGQHNHPVYKNVKLPFNNGVNIALAKDTAVKAVFDGTVSNVVVIPGYNQCVLVQHGGYFTFYCKLASVNVKAGDKIKTGQVLGRVDTIAGETQLHFELWEGRTPQNPEFWLK